MSDAPQQATVAATASAISVGAASSPTTAMAAEVTAKLTAYSAAMTTTNGGRVDSCPDPLSRVRRARERWSVVFTSVQNARAAALAAQGPSADQPAAKSRR